MCEHGNTVDYQIAGKGKVLKIDKCIYPLVRWLNENGIRTIACCCGHGKHKGEIIIERKGE